jgi:hypothetical protein
MTLFGYISFISSRPKCYLVIYRLSAVDLNVNLYDMQCI